MKYKNTSGPLKVLAKNKINFCKNFKFLQTKFKRKKLEAGFVSAAEQRRIANHPHHKDSCIVYLLVIEKFGSINNGDLLHLFFWRNIPFLLRSQRQLWICPQDWEAEEDFYFLFCIFRSMDYASLLPQRKTNQTQNQTSCEIICITAVNRLAPCHVKPLYHTAGI